MKKENDKFVILMQQNLGKLQPGEVPACALSYALLCVVNNVGTSLIKINKLSQGCRIAGPELATAPGTLYLGGQVRTKFMFKCANINKKIAVHLKIPLSRDSLPQHWMPLSRDSPPQAP